MTAEGLQKLKDDLDHAINVMRPEIADKLAKAIADGDLKENANYHDAKEKAGLNEGRVKQYEDSIRRAKVIQEGVASTGVVVVGSTVVIAEVGSEDEDEEEEYRIVGPREADPDKGLISNESPIGKALLGKKKGQKATVLSPRGELIFKVLKIK
ncbi:MAG: transcription elongation factor GreA [Cellvibrionaceae bacterium]|jgi:transcription elongation factor GreA